MSTTLTTPEDYKFFDYLAPHRWPTLNKEQIQLYRELVATGELQIETILENTLTILSNGQYTRVCENSHDFSDYSDSKKSTSILRRNNTKTDHYMNSCRISGIKNKIGLLRILAYSKQQDKFYHYAIPHNAYKNINTVDIIMDSFTGKDNMVKGIPKGKWTKYEVPNLYILATITHEQQTKIK